MRRDTFLSIIRHHNPKLASKVDVVFALSSAWVMSESDSDFEMLEKRLSDLNPDELILVTARIVSFQLCRTLTVPASKHPSCRRWQVPSLRCSTYTICQRISAMHRVKEQLVWERCDDDAILPSPSLGTCCRQSRCSQFCAGRDVHAFNQQVLQKVDHRAG